MSAIQARETYMCRPLIPSPPSVSATALTLTGMFHRLLVTVTDYSMTKQWHIVKNR